MGRWSGILEVPIFHDNTARCRVAASLLFHSSNNLAIPSANVIFYSGDRVEGAENPVIQRLSCLQTISEILVSKFGSSINAWVIEASVFNGSFAIYKEFVPSVNWTGDPKFYEADGFPASLSTLSILSNFLKLTNFAVEEEKHDKKTIILGFSKGGVVVNQLMTEVGSSSGSVPEIGRGGEKGRGVIPGCKEELLNSIKEVHYVDVGLNSAGVAYLTDRKTIRRISESKAGGGMRVVMHGTGRQWKDQRMGWIKREEEEMVQLLKAEGDKIGGGGVDVLERSYFGDRPPDLQMHFQIIEELDVS